MFYELGTYWIGLRNSSNTRQKTLPGFQVRGVRSSPRRIKYVILLNFLLATRYKGEWVLKSLRACRSTRATMSRWQKVYSLLSDPSTIYIMCRRASSMIRYHFLLLKLKIKMEANILLTQCMAWLVLYNDIKFWILFTIEDTWVIKIWMKWNIRWTSFVMRNCFSEVNIPTFPTEISNYYHRLLLEWRRLLREN